MVTCEISHQQPLYYIRPVATYARPATAITTSRSLRAPAATRVPNQHLLLGLKKNRLTRLRVTYGFLAAQTLSAQRLAKKELIRSLKVLRPFPYIGNTYKTSFTTCISDTVC